MKLLLFIASLIVMILIIFFCDYEDIHIKIQADVFPEFPRIYEKLKECEKAKQNCSFIKNKIDAMMISDKYIILKAFKRWINNGISNFNDKEYLYSFILIILSIIIFKFYF